MSERFHILDEKEAKVIELKMPAGADAAEFDWLNQSELVKIDAKQGDAWIMDLSKCSYVGSAALGFMLNVRQRVQGAGGVLVLCEVSSNISAILRTSSLGRLFTIAGTRKDALSLIHNWRARWRG